MDTRTPAAQTGNGSLDQASARFGVSIRAWLSLIIIGTVCAISIFFAVATVKAGGELKIGEPLYLMAAMALGFFLDSVWLAAKV